MSRFHMRLIIAGPVRGESGVEEAKVTIRTKRKFSDKFEADVVRQCAKGDRSVAQVAQDVGVSHDSV